MKASSENIFWQFDVAHWYQALNSSPDGLSQTQAITMLAASGHPAKSSSAFKKGLYLFLRQYKSPLMLLMIGAVVLSFFLGDTTDAYILLTILLSSGLVGFWQEYNSEQVLQKLESMIALQCTIVRAGKAQEMPAANIVPGDVLEFNAGDMIPADCLLIEANELYANEASLTGESFPTRKEPAVLPAQTELASRVNCLWKGTNIVSGNARAMAIMTNVFLER